MTLSGKMAYLWAFLGLLAGGWIGFMLRPVHMLIGRIPFKHTATMGFLLEGQDLMYETLAHRSFNYMLVGGVLGFLIVILGVFSYDRYRETLAASKKSAETSGSVDTSPAV